ncbi:hypothetical protein SDC9_178504 [bioreactor metagenome]|uniref:Hydroxyacylglutathione hydrolase n=2 Tax=root TaxID=1 RepID=A0A645H5A9_9ZZZZ
MITGDCIALYECYESEPMIPNGVHTDLIEYYNQMERIKRMKKKVLPGHDFKVFTQGCYQ